MTSLILPHDVVEELHARDRAEELRRTQEQAANMAALGVNSWLLVEGLLASADYKLIVLGTVGAYIAGNVLQKGTEKNGQQSNP